MKKLFFFVFLLLCSLGVSAQSPIVILHTNDTHSQIESFLDKNGNLQGGIAGRSAHIDSVRSQYENVLLMDAGDFCQGTAYFNFFKGKSEISLMNQLGYNVGCLGNHEFDNGSASLAKVLRKANYPIVCANYLFFNKALNKIVKKYVVIEIGGKKFGVFGLLTDIRSLTIPENYSDIKYLNAIDVADCVVKDLLEIEHCDYVVCLSHLGFEGGTEENPDDQMLASQVRGINFIIGGHTHTKLSSPKIVNGTYIFQTGKKGEYLGEIIIR